MYVPFAIRCSALVVLHLAETAAMAAWISSTGLDAALVFGCCCGLGVELLAVAFLRVGIWDAWACLSGAAFVADGIWGVACLNGTAFVADEVRRLRKQS